MPTVEGSRKTVSFVELIMSKDKYLSIFSDQMEAIVFIIVKISSFSQLARFFHMFY